MYGRPLSEHRVCLSWIACILVYPDLVLFPTLGLYLFEGLSNRFLILEQTE
jgi:hypothetical protein